MTAIAEQTRSFNPTGTTSTADFLAVVGAHLNRALVFELEGEVLVQPGYHVTEVKAVTVEAMDCGGQADAWRETVVQLSNSGNELDRGHMPVSKFLSIYTKVASSVPVRPEAEVRFEYGDARRPAVHYHVAGLRPEGEALVVELRAPGVTCKANDRAAQAGVASRCGPGESAQTGSSCCGPAATTQPVTLEVAAPKGGCCG